MFFVPITGQLAEYIMRSISKTGHFISELLYQAQEVCLLQHSPIGQGRQASEQGLSLVGRCLLANARNEAQILALKEEMDLGKTRAVCCLPLPTLAHQIVDLPRTRRRPLRNASSLAVLLKPVAGVRHHLFMAELRERCLSALHQHFPQRHRERPHVALATLLPLQSKPR